MKTLTDLKNDDMTDTVPELPQFIKKSPSQIALSKNDPLYLFPSISTQGSITTVSHHSPIGVNWLNLKFSAEYSGSAALNADDSKIASRLSQFKPAKNTQSEPTTSAMSLESTDESASDEKKSPCTM